MTEIPTLDEGLHGLAAQLREARELTDSVDLDRVLTAASAVLQTLASAGASGPLAVPAAHDGDTCAEVDRQLDNAQGELNSIGMWLVRHGASPRRPDGSYDIGAALDELVSAQAVPAGDPEATRQLRHALGGGVSGDWHILLGKVRDLAMRGHHRLRAVAELLAALGDDSDVIDPVDAWASALAEVRSRVARTDDQARQLSEALGQLDLLRRTVPPPADEGEPAELVAAVLDRIRYSTSHAAELQGEQAGFLGELRELLGLSGGVPELDRARQQVIGNVRTLVQRLAAKSKQATFQQMHTRDTQRSEHSTLVDMLKVLATYAPGHEEMSADELRAEVNGVLGRTLADLQVAQRERDFYGAHLRRINSALDLHPHADPETTRRAITTLQQRVEEMGDRIEQVRQLHGEGVNGWCVACDEQQSPCRTAQALGDEEPPESDDDPDEDEPAPDPVPVLRPDGWTHGTDRGPRTWQDSPTTRLRISPPDGSAPL